MAELSPKVRDALDDLVSFDGHNDFIGAGGTVRAKSTIAALVATEPIDLDAVERHLRKKVFARELRSEDGVKYALDWFRHSQRGGRFRNGGRYIT